MKKTFKVVLTASIYLLQIVNSTIPAMAESFDIKGIGVENTRYYKDDKIITFSEGTAKLDNTDIISGVIVKAEGKHVLVYTSGTGIISNIEFTIDKTPPKIEGIIEGSDYKDDRKITFNEGTAKLDDKDFANGDIAKEEGKHQLIVTDLAGNSTIGDFNIDKTSPVVSGVKDNESYKEGVKINFNEGMATLNGKSFTNGATVGEEGQYSLNVIDWAGNKSVVNFTISKANAVNNDNKIFTPVSTEVLNVDDKKISDEIDRAISENQNPIPGITIEPVVKVDFTDRKEDNLDIVLNSQKINEIKDNKLTLDIQTKDVNIKINSNVISKDLAGENVKEVIVSKSHVDKADESKFNSKISEQNPNGTILGDVMKFNLSVKDNMDNIKNVENFSDKVKVRIKLTPEQISNIKDKRKVAVYNLLEDGTYVYSGGVVKDGNIDFETEHFSFYITMENNKTFSDIESSWARDQIEVLASRNIIMGVGEGNGHFNTKATITRAQFSILISKVLSLKPVKYSVVFNDVKENQYFSNYVLSAYNNGVLKGDGEFFRPDDNISREQIATVIMTAYKKALADKGAIATNIQKYFDINQVADYAFDSVREANGLGIMKGFPDNTFNPKKSLTREESAVIIYKFMELTKMI